jgi:hypothetical protein
MRPPTRTQRERYQPKRRRRCWVAEPPRQHGRLSSCRRPAGRLRLCRPVTPLPSPTSLSGAPRTRPAATAFATTHRPENVHITPTHSMNHPMRHRAAPASTPSHHPTKPFDSGSENRPRTADVDRASRHPLGSRHPEGYGPLQMRFGPCPGSARRGLGE